MMNLRAEYHSLPSGNDRITESYIGKKGEEVEISARCWRYHNSRQEKRFVYKPKSKSPYAGHSVE